MTEASRPWSGTSTGDAGPYSSLQWQTQYSMLFGADAHDYQGIIPESGSIGNIPLEVIEDATPSADVRLRVGAALLHGTFYYNDALLDLTVSANVSGNDRIDTVVLTWNSTLQTIRASIVEGTPAGSPVPPTLTDSSTVKYMPLADIAVSNGFSTITDADITPRAKPIIFSNLVLMVVENNSGADIDHGLMLEWDTSNDRSIQKSDSGLDAEGVSFGNIPNAEWGLMVQRGIMKVYADGAVTRGEALVYGGSTAGEMTSETHTNQIRIAEALETTSAAGYVLSYVCMTKPPLLNKYTYDTNVGGYSLNNASYQAMDSTNLKATIVTRTGRVRIDFTAQLNEIVSGTVNCYFDVYVDNSTYASSGSDFDYRNIDIRGYGSIHTIIDGLSEGSHTFEIHWRTSNTVTVGVVKFIAQESL